MKKKRRGTFIQPQAPFIQHECHVTVRDTKDRKHWPDFFLACFCFHLHVASWRCRLQLVYYFLEEVSIFWQAKCRQRHSKRHSTCSRSTKEMGLEQHPGPAVNICPSHWCCRDRRVSGGSALGRTCAACRLVTLAAWSCSRGAQTFVHWEERQ